MSGIRRSLLAGLLICGAVLLVVAQRTEDRYRRLGSPSRPSGPQQGRPGGCRCLVTSEFNPVCGTNGKTYSNPGDLKCAKKCGTNVDILVHGNCPD